MRRILVKTSEEKKIIFKCLLLFIVLVVVDQITKYIIVTQHELVYKPFIVIPGIFNIVSVRNTGAAWGMFNGNNILLLSVAVVAFIILIYFFRSIAEGCSERYYAISLILSGIVGNSCDRVIRGSVVDFLDFYYKSYHWPSFNVADSAICVGVCLLIVSFLFRSPK